VENTIKFTTILQIFFPFHVWTIVASTIFVLLWNESLHNDGQQLHQYQQNEQSLLISNNDHCTKYKIMTYDVRNPGLGLGHAQKCGEVKPVNGILIRLLIIGYPAANINTR